MKADRWQDAIDGIKSTLSAEAIAAQKREQPTVQPSEATAVLFGLFDKLVKVGHNFLHLKNAFRAKDSEKVGLVSWSVFIAVLESEHWQFTQQQLQTFHASLQAAGIVRPGAGGFDVVAYVNFILCIRSWQHHKQSTSNNMASDNQRLTSVVSRSASPSPRHNDSQRFKTSSRRRPQTRQQQQRRRGGRRRPNRGISITDESYPIDPVLRDLIGQT